MMTQSESEEQGGECEVVWESVAEDTRPAVGGARSRDVTPSSSPRTRLSSSSSHEKTD